MNKSTLTKKVYSNAAKLLVKSSVKVAADSASLWMFYQPRIPKSIK